MSTKVTNYLVELANQGSSMLHLSIILVLLWLEGVSARTWGPIYIIDHEVGP